MIDIGWSELLVIGVVALIVVGPKDLPILFKRMGEFTGKARAMAREFTSAMEKAADEAGVKDIQRDLRKIADPKQMGLDAISDAAKEMTGLAKSGTKAPTGVPARVKAAETPPPVATPPLVETAKPADAAPATPEVGDEKSA